MSLCKRRASLCHVSVRSSFFSFRQHPRHTGLEIFQPGQHPIIPDWKPSSGSASTLVLRKATNESRTATCGGVLEPNLSQRIGRGRKSLYGPARGLLERISILGWKERYLPAPEEGIGASSAADRSGRMDPADRSGRMDPPAT